MKLQYLLCHLSLFLFLAMGCNRVDKPEDTDQTIRSGDSLKYIKFENAGVFLTSWNKENTLVYHTNTDPDDMHPTNGTNSVRSEIFLYTQMFLVGTDFRQSEIRPSLVKNLPVASDDLLKYTFELRDEPRWDNGDQLEVSDIIFTGKANLCQLTNNPFVKPYWENMKEIVPDPVHPRKFTVIMKRPYLQNVSFWVDFPILQQKYFDKDDVFSRYTWAQLGDSAFVPEQHPDLIKWASEFNDPKYGHDLKYLTGIGMYGITGWSPGQSIILTKKKNHWTNTSTHYCETSFPETIIFKVISDANAQELEFKSQALDATGSISTKVLLKLRENADFNKNYNSGFIDTYNYSYAAFNTKPDGIQHKKLFTDPKTRRALALLTPVDQMIQIVHKGKNKRMTGPVSFLKKEFNKDLNPIPFDIEMAKTLLDEAGWNDTDGDNIRDKIIDGSKVQMDFKLNFYTTSVEWRDMAGMIAESMYKAGVKVNLNPLDVATMVQKARQHDFDMMLGSWASSMLPEDFTQLWHTSSWSSEGSNYPGFGNASSDALIDSIKFTLADSLRIPMVKKFQTMVYNEQPYIFLFSSIRRVVVHKRFANGEMYFERPGLILNNLRLLSPGLLHTNSTAP